MQLSLLYWSLLFQALAVCTLFRIKRFATPTCRLTRLRVGDDLSLMSNFIEDIANSDFKIKTNVETYGCWRAEARLHLSRLASRLAARLNCSKSHATSTLYGRLNLVLVRANARALLSRAYGVGSDIPA